MFVVVDSLKMIKSYWFLGVRFTIYRYISAFASLDLIMFVGVDLLKIIKLSWFLGVRFTIRTRG